MSWFYRLFFDFKSLIFIGPQSPVQRYFIFFFYQNRLTFLIVFYKVSNRFLIPVGLLGI